MQDANGRDMNLTPDAEIICQALVDLGGVATSGHRDVTRQAHAMASNVVNNRRWIEQTYKHGAPFQAMIDAHPEWVTVDELSLGLFDFMMANPDLTKLISHHLLSPCPCFDLDPDRITPEIEAKAAEYQAVTEPGQPRIVQILRVEGGLPKYHVECAELPDVKVQEGT